MRPVSPTNPGGRLWVPGSRGNTRLKTKLESGNLYTAGGPSRLLSAKRAFLVFKNTQRHRVFQILKFGIWISGFFILWLWLSPKRLFFWRLCTFSFWSLLPRILRISNLGFGSWLSPKRFFFFFAAFYCYISVVAPSKSVFLLGGVLGVFVLFHFCGGFLENVFISAGLPDSCPRTRLSCLSVTTPLGQDFSIPKSRNSQPKTYCDLERAKLETTAH